jgi:3-deoxy-7-phosphoheptulonate synthase
MSATIEDFLLAAEYVLSCGNRRVILCERGIRTFERATRNTLDIGAIPVLKSETHLPVLVDPSHAAGRRDLVLPLALAAVAVGADGLLVEVHPDPDRARSDGDQSLSLPQFAAMMADVAAVRETVTLRRRDALVG